MGIQFSVVQEDFDGKRFMRIDGDDNLSSNRIRHLIDKHDLDYVTHGVGLLARDFYFCPNCKYIVSAYLDSLVGSRCWECQLSSFSSIKSDTINAISCVSTEDSEVSDEIIRDNDMQSSARIKNINYINNYAAGLDLETSNWNFGPVKIDFDETNDVRNEKLVRMTIKSCRLKKVQNQDENATIESKHSWIEIESKHAYYVIHFRFLSGELLVCARRFNSIIDCDKEGIEASGQKHPCHVWNEPFCRIYNNNRHFFPSASDAPLIGSIVEWARIEGFHPKYHLLSDSISQHFSKALFAQFK